MLNHAQPPTKIYACKGNDKFVREHKDLSFGVQWVYWSTAAMI